jgi:hypothetical protein
VCTQQGSFFWLQNTEGEPVVGGWLQIHQPEVLPPYFTARKKNPGTQCSVFFGLFGKMKIWPPRFFLGWFSGNINFLQSKVGKTENVVINEGAYTIL